MSTLVAAPSFSGLWKKGHRDRDNEGLSAEGLSEHGGETKGEVRNGVALVNRIWNAVSSTIEGICLKL